MAILTASCSSTPTAPTAADGSPLPAGTTSPARPTGPFGVGTRQLAGGGIAWYPADPKANEQVTFELSDWLPAGSGVTFTGPGTSNAEPSSTCPCPVLVLIHGAGGFPAQFHLLAADVASRGFVAIAPNLDGIGIRAYVGQEMVFGGSELDTIATAPEQLNQEAGTEIARLTGVVLAGQSVGGGMAVQLVDRLRPAGIIRLGSGGYDPVEPLPVPQLFIGVRDDAVVPVGQVERSYDLARAPKALALLPSGGTLALVDVCNVDQPAGDVLQTIEAQSSEGAALAGLIHRDCSVEPVVRERNSVAVRGLVTGFLERVLVHDAEVAAESDATREAGVEFRQA